MLGGSHVAAGTYAVYTVPREDGWTVILSSAVGEWGAFSYDETRDVLRVEAPVQHDVPVHEAFTIEFEETGSGADMLLTWESTRARLAIMAH